MNCASFEDGLTRILAEGDGIDDRDSLVAELKAHAAACPECAGSLALVDWAGCDPSERFDDEDPGEEYWASFDDRLKNRLVAERKPSSRMAPYLSAAAAVLLAAVLMITGYPPERTPGNPEPQQMAEEFEWGLEMNNDGWLFPDTAGMEDEERQELLEWLNQEAAATEGGQA